ncbi:MAG: GAF domain-containing protein [Anaerolineae bacterium]|nr:GAF domain-containing protein [Anaerolineae bacterium]
MGQDEYTALQDRVRRLEGLVKVAFDIPGPVDTSSIIGDLRNGARIAVDADDMAVLLVDRDYTDISDALNLGVPGRYLVTCREIMQSLPHNERMSYLGDEVLLRERLPGMLPTASRIREAEAAGAWSYMRLPLTDNQRLIGIVAFFSNNSGQFNGAHLQLGRLFAGQVTTTVRNARLYLRLNRAEKRQQAVEKVARLLAEDMTLDAALARIAEEAIRLVQGRRAAVLLVQPDRSLIVSTVFGDGVAQPGHKLLPGSGQAGLIALTGQPSVITNFRDWNQSDTNWLEQFPEGGILLGVPLTYRGRVLGVLQVITDTMTPGEIEDSQDVLMMLAPQAATAIAKAQLHEIVEQDRQQLRAILDHTAAAVVVCDADGRILLMNPEAQHVLVRLGIPLERIQDRPLAEMLDEWMPDRDFCVEDISNILEIDLGPVGEYLIHIAPITKSDGTIDRYVGVAQDVSQLRQLDRMKSDMIHILSHDLRNPLGLARGSIDLLEEPDLPPEQRKQLTEMIINSLDRMEELIKDVTDLEMAESLGQQTVIPYQLGPIVQQVVKRNEGKARQSQITLRYHEDAPPKIALKGHAVLIGQAIDNLVGNAIKYTTESGYVDVTLSGKGDYAVVKVVDTGYGIPPEDLPYVFEQFYRAQDRRIRHIPGTGLGLSLVRTIAEAHGGSITVESEVDQGSTFALYLPLNEQPLNHTAKDHIRRLDLSDWAKSVQARRSE